MIRFDILAADSFVLIALTERSKERRLNAIPDVTPASFHRGLRLNRAVSLLLNTLLSAQEIGVAVGFFGGFTTAFKRATGITPDALRKSRRLKTDGPPRWPGKSRQNDGFCAPDARQIRQVIPSTLPTRS